MIIHIEFSFCLFEALLWACQSHFDTQAEFEDFVFSLPMTGLGKDNLCEKRKMQNQNG